jgi:hypothetical protein
MLQNRTKKIIGWELEEEKKTTKWELNLNTVFDSSLNIWLGLVVIDYWAAL